MSFHRGFIKLSGLLSGFQEAGNQTVKDVLILKGMREALGDIRKTYKGKMGSLFTTGDGRDSLLHAIGKSAPSSVALGGYGILAKKIYNKTREQSQNQYDQMHYG